MLVLSQLKYAKKINSELAILINSSETNDDIKIYYHKNNEIMTINIEKLEEIILKTDE